MNHMTEGGEMMNMGGNSGAMMAMCLVWTILALVLIVLGIMAIIVMYRKYFRNTEVASKKSKKRD